MAVTETDEAAARRVLRLLERGPAELGFAGRAGLVLVSGKETTIAVPEPVLRGLVEAGRAMRDGSRLALSGTATGGAPAINLAESPLAQLARLRLRDGRSFLSTGEVEAGERLRADYTRGRIMPRLGANWEAAVAPGRRSSAGHAADLTDAALSARRRVEDALGAVGPELSGLLVDVCCFLKGMELVERERGWPVRSAKVVLKTALGALARHYRPPASAKAHRPVLHWGAEDFRPAMDRL